MTKGIMGNVQKLKLQLMTMDNNNGTAKKWKFGQSIWDRSKKLMMCVCKFAEIEEIHLWICNNSHFYIAS